MRNWADGGGLPAGRPRSNQHRAADAHGHRGKRPADLPRGRDQERGARLLLPRRGRETGHDRHQHRRGPRLPRQHDGHQRSLGARARRRRPESACLRKRRPHQKQRRRSGGPLLPHPRRRPARQAHLAPRPVQYGGRQLSESHTGRRLGRGELPLRGAGMGKKDDCGPDSTCGGTPRTFSGPRGGWP